VESRRENGDEIFTFSPKKFSLPKVTVIHRLTRLGFKGGALQNALGYTHPSSEYILVFDADFIPYPDTIEQFLKYFQLAKGNQGKSGVSRVNQGEETLDQPSSPVINPDRIAAVQGYQWHVLNKSENWITRGVRTEYAGSYVIERAGIEFYGGLKMIAGSVFCIRADLLRRFGWGTSITEDFQLTLRLYEAGYKVLYTPYIQAPSECVSTIRRLARQRMRWAEGHTYNVRKMWSRLFSSPNLTGREKFEFLYLGPYYLQATFFLVGTLAWLIAEVVIHVRLPFWSAIWGWPAARAPGTYRH
jgi:cellulose synthase/poly-beta-1,6-N-acetylglucosamine synthase-like glycosyltransferase